MRDHGWLDLNGLREIEVASGVRTERHLLRPFDVLVTARAGAVQTALVPPGVSRTVAGVTLPRCTDLSSRNLAWATGFGIFSRRLTAGRNSPDE